MTEFFVYILECKDHSLYTGYTVDLERRLSTHNSGRGAKYTRSRRPVKIVYSMGFPTKSQAMSAEYWIKKMSPDKKRDLIQGNLKLDQIIPSDS